MKKTELLDLCYKKFQPLILNLNLILYDIEYIREPKGNILRFYIDKTCEPVSIDDCEIVSEKISDILDELDPIEESYYLEVSSKDLSRPFKNDKDFYNNIGKQVELKFYAPINGNKELVGILKDFNDEQIIIELENTLTSFSRKQVSTVKLSVFE